MWYAWKVLVTLVLRRPLVAGSLATLSGIGVGLALATPGIGWHGPVAPGDGAALIPEGAPGPDEAAVVAALRAAAFLRA